MAEDQATEYYRNMLEKKLSGMTSAADEIINMTRAMVRRVPENVFKHEVLPLLRGWIVGQPVEIGRWMNIADGMENEIIVVDGENKELFICPPPFIEIIPRSDFGRRGELAGHAIMHMQGMMFDNGDVREAINIDANLTNLMLEKPDSALKTAALTKLIKIYLRYDIPMVELLGDHTEEILAAYAKLLEERGETAPDALNKDAKEDDAGEEEQILIY